MRSILRCQRILGALLCNVSLLASQSAIAQDSATFQGLGDLSGGLVSSSAGAVSADGLVVVGVSDGGSGREAFRWTIEGGMIGLGDLAGGDFNSKAYDVSWDGSVVVGRSLGASGDEAFLWRATSGMIGIGDLAGGRFSSGAYGISLDGTVVVGMSHATLGPMAFRWTLAGGMVNLGDLPGGGTWSRANACSSDGTWIVGRGSSSQAIFEALRWTAWGNMFPMGDFSGGVMLSDATAITDDGQYIVGFGVTADGQRAFRWSSSTGMINLGTLGEVENNSIAAGINGDGSVVVGEVEDPDSVAFVWNETSGMRSLQNLLVQQYRLDLIGWTLQWAVDISYDGSVIVGRGLNPQGDQEGWIVRLPPIEPCPADTDGSGVVNVTDLLALIGAWGVNPGHSADFNGDWIVNTTDLLVLIAAWGACP